MMNSILKLDFSPGTYWVPASKNKAVRPFDLDDVE